MPKSRKTGPSYNTPQGLKTRNIILDAAGKVFAGKGYQAATIQMIAKESGVVVSMVMHHFGSKENLYSETMQHHIIDSGRWDYIFSPLLNESISKPKEVDLAIAECVQRYLCRPRPGDPPYLKWLGIRLLMDDVPAVQKIGLTGMDKISTRFMGILKRVYPVLNDGELRRWIQTFWSLLLFPTAAHNAICIQNNWKNYPPGYLEQWAKDISFFGYAALSAEVTRKR
jgi:AcrR family transcriptional regulator